MGRPPNRPDPLLGQTIGDCLDATVAAHGDREALVSCHQDLRYSWTELGAAVDRVARGLLAAGLDAGDRLGIWSPNCAEWVLVQLAAARLGVILVNLNPAYRTSELGFALRQSGCRALVAAPAFKSSDYRAMVAECRDELPALELVWFLDGPDWDALLDDGDAVAAEDVAARQAATQFDEPINIQYTSGTTGFPKGATLSHHNILNNGYFVGRGCGYDETDRVAIPVPFYHCFGMVMGNLACVSHGACMVVPAPAFDPSRPSRRCSPSAARRSTACRPCSSPSSSTSASPSSTSARCGPGSWPARRARSRRCGGWSPRCTWRR